MNKFSNLYLSFDRYRFNQALICIFSSNTLTLLTKSLLHSDRRLMVGFSSFSHRNKKIIEFELGVS